MASEEEIIIIGGGGKPRPKRLTSAEVIRDKAIDAADGNPYAVARAMIDHAEATQLPIRFTKGQAVDIRKDGTEYDDEPHGGMPGGQ